MVLLKPFRMLAAGLTLGVSFVAQPAPAAAQEMDPALFQDMEWRNIGPFRGGRSVAATGVTSEPYTYYFGGVGSGVWKTTNAGQTWENISDDTFGTSSVGAIAVAESDPNVVYVGMGEHAPRGVMTSHGDGVYKSTDAGRTWRHMGLPDSRAISGARTLDDTTGEARSQMAFTMLLLGIAAGVFSGDRHPETQRVARPRG